MFEISGDILPLLTIELERGDTHKDSPMSLVEAAEQEFFGNLQIADEWEEHMLKKLGEDDWAEYADRHIAQNTLLLVHRYPEEFINWMVLRRMGVNPNE